MEKQVKHGQTVNLSKARDNKGKRQIQNKKMIYIRANKNTDRQ